MGPWTVKGATTCLKERPPHLNLAEISFAPYNFWMQIHNLVLNRMTTHNVIRIENFIGKFLKQEGKQSLTNIKGYKRIQVQIDTIDILKARCYITRESEQRMWITFKYERLVDFCYRCGKMDHTETTCVKEQTTKNDQGQPMDTNYEPWMRAQIGSPMRNPHRRNTQARPDLKETLIPRYQSPIKSPQNLGKDPEGSTRINSSNTLP